MVSARLTTPHMQRQAGQVNVQPTPANRERLGMNAVDLVLALGTGHLLTFFIFLLSRCLFAFFALQDLHKTEYPAYLP